MKNVNMYVLGVANCGNLTYEAFFEGYQKQVVQISRNMTNLSRMAFKLAKLAKRGLLYCSNGISYVEKVCIIKGTAQNHDLSS